VARHGRAVYGAMVAFDGTIELDSSLRDLVSLRASILNGCAYWVDMHTLDARHRGESEQRL
jgi:AhpD family alkylhydroperoxidase